MALTIEQLIQILLDVRVGGPVEDPCWCALPMVNPRAKHSKECLTAREAVK